MSSLTFSSLPQRIRGAYLDKCNKISLTANLFKVSYNQETKIFIFTVKTLPEIPRENGKKLRSLLMNSRKLIEKLLGQYIISGRTVFGTKYQPLGNNAQMNMRINFQESNYQIFFKMVKEISMAEIKQADRQKSGSVFTFLNNMVRNFFHQLQYSQIGRSRKFFDAKSKIDLQGANVTIFKGFSSSFSLLEGGLYLKIDPVMKIIRQQTVLQVINKIYKINSSSSKTQKRAMVDGELLGKCVMANYGKNKYYIIQSILFDKSIEQYQFLLGQKHVNLFEYYRQTYGITIQSKKQPLVKVALNQKSKVDSCKAKTEIILVPQLLLMSGLPDDFDQRKRMEISQATIVKPSEKLSQVENLFNLFNRSKNQQFNPEIIASKLGISIQNIPSKISAKQLHFPELQLGGRERIHQSKTSNFNLFDKNLFNCDTSMNIAVFFPSDFDFNSTIVSIFSSTCKNLGLRYKFNTYPINFRETKGALSSIQSNVIKESQNNTANIFWFILPSNFKNQYKNLKRYTLKVGIERNSQVSLTSTLFKKNSNSIITKILLQMAAKVGNKLWVPKINPKIQSAGVMLVGIQKVGDNEDKSMNIISYCSNTNKDFSAFYSNYIYQNKNDLKTNMTQIIFECINEYIIKNQSPPSNIILLKNGSAEFDKKIFIQTEVDEIKEVLRNSGKSIKIRLIYIIIDKNVSLKLFSKRGNDIVNPLSGTLINSDAIGNGFEFYLIAQQCNRGTVKPTFYKVIYSDSNLEEGLIEDLLFTQCFNYMNWSGSIKVPNIMQYAKKLGMFVGQYINNESTMTDINKNLYYI